MQALASLLHTCRSSRRLIQSMLLAFVLSLGAASAAPAIQASALTPDQQIICVGAGGMKVVTFAADGSVSDAQSLQDSSCTWCGTLAALPLPAQVVQGLQASPEAYAAWRSLPALSRFQSLAPPARAPPLAS